MFSPASLICATSSLLAIVARLQAVSATPLPDLARLLEREATVTNGIQLNKDGNDGLCLIDLSATKDSQVGTGDCRNQDAPTWEFTGDIIEWKSGSKYWVGTIKNKKRGWCLTIDDKVTRGKMDPQVANNGNVWKAITTDCGGDAVKDRQKWMIGMSIDGKQNGNFIRPAHARFADCSFQGLSGYKDYTYWPDLWPIESDKGLVSVVCVSPDHTTTGWKTRIGDTKFGF